MDFGIQALNPNVNKVILLSFWTSLYLGCFILHYWDFVHALFAQNYLLTFKESSLALRAWNQRLKSLTTGVPGQSSEPLFGCPDTIVWCEITNSTWIQQHRLTMQEEAVPDVWQWRHRREQRLALSITGRCCSGGTGGCRAAELTVWAAPEHPAHRTWTRESALGAYGMAETPTQQVRTTLHWAFTHSAVEVDQHPVCTLLPRRQALT